MTEPELGGELVEYLAGKKRYEGLARGFRFTAYEQHVLFKAVMERLKQVQADPGRDQYERYKLQQLMEKFRTENHRKDPPAHADG